MHYGMSKYVKVVNEYGFSGTTTTVSKQLR
jgi:hypothetical protein